MGVKSIVKRVGRRAGNRVAKLAELSPYQVEAVQYEREMYLLEEPNPSDSAAIERTKRMMAASSIEIFNAYLPQIKELYLPIQKDAEFEAAFDSLHNIRYFNITKWVVDTKENNIEKLVNVYAVLSKENCNIALVFNRTQISTNVYLAVVNTQNDNNNVSVDIYKNRLIEAIRGNFPGAEWDDNNGIGVIPCFNNDKKYSVATASNIPTEKSEKFISQTIEKLLDGIIPSSKKTEYTIVLLATPIMDVEERKLKLGEFYSGLAPYSTWQTDYHFNDNQMFGSSATVGVNVGTSAGIQNGANYSTTGTEGTSDNTSRTDTSSNNETGTEGSSYSESNSNAHSEGESSTTTTTDGINGSTGSSIANSSSTTNESSSSHGGEMSAGVGAPWGHAEIGVNWNETNSVSNTQGITETVTQNSGWSKSTAKALGKTATDTITRGLTNSISSSVAKTTGTAVANTLGRAVTKAMATTAGVARSVSFGANFGANFARSSTVSAMVGKSEGITQTFTNYNIKHALELLESQMKRLEQSTALGMWDFAAYILSEDQSIANNVAHSYLALTLGEESYMSKSAINLWMGNVEEEKEAASTICSYIKELRHPLFGLNPMVIKADPQFNEYPSIVTAATSLSGKELAYSLNFPQKSISGLPVLKCAEFGRDIVSYDTMHNDKGVEIGKIFYMNKKEKQIVLLSLNSLASHTFITGSTGSGKSNTVYQILNEAWRSGKNFLVVEPAKGEYKEVFGGFSEVSVYGTNPKLTPLLKLNPFSFPEDIHVYEHIDRLVEIFNVCWPMYAAMPAVLKNAVEKSYIDCGWDMIESVNEYGNNMYPTFADVVRNVRSIIDSSEYDAENKSAYKGSLLTRLQSLTNGINGLIFSNDEISNKELFDNKVIVDLSRVGSTETKSLIMGMLVLKLQEYRMTSGRINSPLRHITVLEEAHNLLKKSSSDMSAESGNLLGKSVEMLSNAIAEMRTYGEGFIIADQAPGLLDLSVIRNTNTKIIMRLPDQSDRELVGYAAGLDEDQINELAKLPCGVGAIYQNEWVQPVLCKINKYSDEYKKYKYKRELGETKEYDYEARVRIAELLSKGMKIDHETMIREIQPELDKLQLSASVKVRIYSILKNPPKEPRMTRIAPVMSELFPNLKKAIENSYQETTVAKEWTNSVESILMNCTSMNIEDQVRRDIVQAIVTDYIFLLKSNVNDLKKWREEGLK